MSQAVIVAHGSPSNPDEQQEALRALARAVGALVPQWEVRGATLAAGDVLGEALRGLDRPLVYPFFMAAGWFTGKELPRRIAALGAEVRQMAPFGLEPELPRLIAEATTKAAHDAGLEPAESGLLLAAHGSRTARRSKDSSYAMAENLTRLTGFGRIAVGLIEEPPFLADTAREIGRGVCLPFFALHAGHVTDDVPQALRAAGFEGPCLPPVGEHPGVPALIAAALRRAAAHAAG